MVIEIWQFKLRHAFESHYSGIRSSEGLKNSNIYSKRYILFTIVTGFPKIDYNVTITEINLIL